MSMSEPASAVGGGSGCGKGGGSDGLKGGGGGIFSCDGATVSCTPLVGGSGGRPQ